MKTTIELPDELARRIKRRAVERDQKLKDTIAQLLEIGLANTTDHTTQMSIPKPVQRNLTFGWLRIVHEIISSPCFKTPSPALPLRQQYLSKGEI